ncbi:AI-2E family transporter [Albibacterium bauzanense]|uniref:Putative PurR-regulated permease PerM n=1 Tax=Albibacterium bauzanense TaxID=653929 RepID=A0A4V2PXS3_9SPHI|nr:AI-2E family transporter [Albibacterium bauzanense]TCK83211.1 putative PurR-regulated permease PerM [Albibacterium bauzanense]
MKNPYIKINQFLLFWILLVIVLIYGRPVLIPITFAALLSMLMAPLIDYLDKKGLKRVFSTIVCIIILLTVIVLLALILIGQLTNIREELPRIETRANELIQRLHDYIEMNFNYPVSSQKEYLQNQVKNLGELSASYLSTILKGASGLLVQTIIMLVVTFLLLFDKEKYRSFFMQVIKGKEQGEKHEILNRITNVSQQYLLGRMISISILFILYFIVLLIIGVENALLLAAVAAVVNVIPYIGPILAGVFPVIIALVTKDSFEPALWVIITFIVIQGIDNYFVTPFVMGGEVNLSALATILIIICGGYIWGIAGMILFVPLLSIAKILFDHTDEFKPYGYLIGDPAEERPSKWFYRWLKEKRDIRKK